MTDMAEVAGGSHFETLEEARNEAQKRRRKNASERHMVTKIEPSPYGGFIVRSLPVDLMVERRSRRIVTERRVRYAEK